MNYFQIGNEFSTKIDNILSSNKIDASFVTGGGFAYKSIKYSGSNAGGDFDFMIVYKNLSQIGIIKNLLRQIDFTYTDNYPKTEINYLNSHIIDVLRLTGTYKGIKSTINLVSINFLREICKMEKTFVIRKLAHNRNTGLFFCYNTNNSRNMVSMFCRNVNLNDNEMHFIHLDISCYLSSHSTLNFGIMLDAILKGYQKHYDSLNFSDIRKSLIARIKYFFINNKIDFTNYITAFANNSYFSQEIKEYLLNEFKQINQEIFDYSSLQLNEDEIIFLYDSNFTTPFNTYIYKKDRGINFEEYVISKQSTEYDRQYLIDLMAKFLGYIFHNKTSINYEKIIINNKFVLYNGNDLYIENCENFTIESILNAFIEYIINSTYMAKELKYIWLNMIFQFAKLKNISYTTLTSNIQFKDNNSEKILSFALKRENGFKENLLKCTDFYSIATIHNYYSSVFEKYTQVETNFIKSQASPNDFILDCMCGYGRIANTLSNEGYKNIYGIDYKDYNILQKKNFHFKQGDYFKTIYEEKFDLIYCLYGCYNSISDIKKLVEKMKSELKNGGKFIIDIFDYAWRNSIDKTQEYTVYEDEDTTLVIKRIFDAKTQIEYSKYILTNGNRITSYDFSQRFFKLSEIKQILNDVQIINSLDLKSRNNNQRFIIIGNN